MEKYDKKDRMKAAYVLFLRNFLAVRQFKNHRFGLATKSKTCFLLSSAFNGNDFATDFTRLAFGSARFFG